MVRSEENIRVIVRARPLNEKEKKNGEVSCITAVNDGREIQVRTSATEATAYRCDYCFTGHISQQDFFLASGLIDLLDSAVGGYRSCAFAFGQTGAGKTYTVVGPGATSSMAGDLRDTSGILGRSIEYLFRKLEQLNIKFAVRVSCLEIYQEQAYDLLTDERHRTSLPVREHPTEGFFAEGCNVPPVANAAEACRVIDTALRGRIVGSHDLNARSNRSHFITEIYIELPGAAVRKSNMAHAAPEWSGLDEEAAGGREYNIMGRATFIDLAGSERLKHTNSKGKGLVETGAINKSLYVLGKVISGMSRRAQIQNQQLHHSKDPGVPFRDSKLTKLLIDSLGGKSRTMMISCISEASGSLTETFRTLKYSMSAASIRNRPVRFLDPQEKLILELRMEIQKLREENMLLRGSLTTAPNLQMLSSLSHSNSHAPPAISDTDPMMRSQSVPAVAKQATTEKENIHPQYTPVLRQQQQVEMRQSRDIAEPQNGGSLRVQRQLSNLKLKLKKQQSANAHRKSPKKQNKPRVIKRQPNITAPRKKISPYVAHLQSRLPVSDISPRLLPVIQAPPAAKPAEKTKENIYFPQLSSKGVEMSQVSPRFASFANPNNSTKSNPVDAFNVIDSIRDKLTRLERQVDLSRQEADAHPSTMSEEEKYSLLALEDEVRDMRLELQIAQQLQGLTTSHNKPKHTDNSQTSMREELPSKPSNQEVVRQTPQASPPQIAADSPPKKAMTTTPTKPLPSAKTTATPASEKSRRNSKSSPPISATRKTPVKPVKPSIPPNEPPSKPKPKPSPKEEVPVIKLHSKMFAAVKKQESGSEMSPVHTPNSIAAVMRPSQDKTPKPMPSVASSSDIRSVISTLSFSKSANPTPSSTVKLSYQANPEDSDSPLAADNIPFSPDSRQQMIPETATEAEKTNPNTERAELSKTAVSLESEVYDNDFEEEEYGDDDFED